VWHQAEGPRHGGLLWYYVSAEAMLWTSAALGIVGAALFYFKFTGAAPAKVTN
jgi:hypothetical protein